MGGDAGPYAAAPSRGHLRRATGRDPTKGRVPPNKPTNGSLKAAPIMEAIVIPCLRSGKRQAETLQKHLGEAGARVVTPERSAPGVAAKARFQTGRARVNRLNNSIRR